MDANAKEIQKKGFQKNVINSMKSNQYMVQGRAWDGPERFG